MKKKLIYVIAAMLSMAGCITNDLPYPVVVPNVVSVTATDAEDVLIDYENRTVTLYFPERVDLRKVNITSVSIDKEIAVPSVNLVGTHNLLSPMKFKIRTYDEYEWIIMAVRNVQRYFTVQGQIGSAAIDPENCRAIVNVGVDTDITDITVTSLKLGPEGLSTYSMDMADMKDFTHGLSVDVTAFDVTETWDLFVEKTDVKVSITSVNAWATSVYVTASAAAGTENGFVYRENGQQEWIYVPEEYIEAEGGTYVAHIIGLQPETQYEVVAYSGEDRSASMIFNTESATPIPNGSFEYARKIAGKDYYKFFDPDCGVEEGSYMFWGSGNGEGAEGVNGSANLGIVITYIDTEEKVDGNQSVRAQTSQMAGMLAAGNLFTGQFAGLVGTSGGKVNFGRPWTSRPTELKLYCKYTTGTVDIVNGTPPGVNITKSDYDRAQIKVAIGNWDYKKYGGTKDSPVHINTTDSRTFVDYATDESTIAHGDLIIHNDGYILNGKSKVTAATDQWIQYTIPLEYHDLEARPTHIIVSCAASQFGDYFTGCSKSKLWIDAVELVY